MSNFSDFKSCLSTGRGRFEQFDESCGKDAYLAILVLALGKGQNTLLKANFNKDASTIILGLTCPGPACAPSSRNAALNAHGVLHSTS
jgi:hypothetical protein